MKNKLLSTPDTISAIKHLSKRKPYYLPTENV